MPVPFRKSYLVVFVLAAALLLSACAAPAVTSVAPTAVVQATATAAAPATAILPTTAATLVPPTSAPTTAPTTASAAITLTDSAGRTVSLPGVPVRILSLAPSNTEIVCALGECDSLIGRDQFSDYPEQVKTLPVLSDGFNPNYEQIVASKPDLILVASIFSPDIIKKLDDLKLPMLVVGSADSSFETVKQDILLVGKALGAESKAAEINAGMDKKLADLQARLAGVKTKPRVFWELDATDPAKPYTSGPGTFVNEIITLAGGENIAGNAPSPYIQINAEEVIKANPEIIIMSDAAYGIAPESVGKRPGWDVIDAVKKNQVYPIDDNLVSRPGPRVIDGLEAAAKLIHPELFQP